MIDETWKPVSIPDFEDFYCISSHGIVINTKTKLGRILKPHTLRGYLRVTLYNGNSRKICAVARLVALSFVPNPNNKPEVNHINGIKTDNRRENLEWCTRSENMKHAAEAGLILRSSEYKRTISERMKGKQYALGNKHTTAAKRKIGEAHTGKKLSKEHKEKISKTMRQNKKG